MGRPTKYDKSYCDKAYKLCLLGAIDKKIADFFDVDEATINRWKDKYPEFCESLKRGKDEADAVIAQSLFHRAKGYSHKDTKFATHEGVITDEKEYTKHHPPDTTAAIFWLKNRQKEAWRDSKDINGSVKHEHTHKHEGLQDADSRIA
ncbi:MAG: hypothetical protein QM500_08590, partial [Methylococcales bacterium]